MITGNFLKRYLDIIQGLKQSGELYDLHVHPFEIFFNQLNYHPNKKNKKIFSVDSSDFPEPQLSEIITDIDTHHKSIFKFFENPKIAKDRILNLYRHIGPEVMRKHMELSGIDRVLLLPVASSFISVESQMHKMKDIFGSDERFIFGWSVCNSVMNHDIKEAAEKVKKQFGIRVVKLHPNVTRTNPVSNSGRERIESILETCNALNLPLIVHGGRSPILKGSEAESYGVLGNLSHIKWNQTHSTVVIAHGGLYGHGFDTINNKYIRILEKLLSKYNNIMVDISGLNVRAIITILKTVDHNRILFGSDSLYESQWQMVVKTLFAIEKTSKQIEDIFFRISNMNPLKFIFRKVS